MCRYDASVMILAAEAEEVSKVSRNVLGISEMFLARDVKESAQGPLKAIGLVILGGSFCDGYAVAGIVKAGISRGLDVNSGFLGRLEEVRQSSNVVVNRYRQTCGSISVNVNVGVGWRGADCRLQVAGCINGG